MPEPIFFAEAISELREYDIAIDEQGDREAHATVLDEAHLRLQQLEHLLRRIRDSVEERFQITERPLKAEALLREFAAAFGREPLPPPDPRTLWTEEQLARRADLAFEVELFADAFYWIAWRLREIIRRLPGMHKFDPEGIRSVRNHIVEHPERHLKLTPARDLALSRTEGVMLRPSTFREHDASLDQGLVANAAELRDRLIAALGRARERHA
jgi:hypothetical protein